MPRGPQPRAHQSGYQFAIASGGKSAAVDSITTFYAAPYAYALNIVDLATGEVSQHLALPAHPTPPDAYPMAANPKVNVLYLAYADSSGNTHLQAIDSVTLAIIQDVDMGAQADSNGYIDIFDAARLRLNGLLYTEGLCGWVAFGDTGYALSGNCGFAPTPAQVVRFDPVSLQVTGSVPLPAGYEFQGFTQPALNGNRLYVPFAFAPQCSDCCTLDIVSYCVAPGCGDNTIRAAPWPRAIHRAVALIAAGFQRDCGKSCGNEGRIRDNLNVRKDFVTKCTRIQQYRQRSVKSFMDSELDTVNYITSGFVTPNMQPNSPSYSSRWRRL